jgi:hypothetical protein
MTPRHTPAILRELRRRRAGIDTEAGLETTEILMWSAVMVVAIVAIGALLQALGVEVVDYIRTQIGV